MAFTVSIFPPFRPRHYHAARTVQTVFSVILMGLLGASVYLYKREGYSALHSALLMIPCISSILIFPVDISISNLPLPVLLGQTSFNTLAYTVLFIMHVLPKRDGIGSWVVFDSHLLQDIFFVRMNAVMGVTAVFYILALCTEITTTTVLAVSVVKSRREEKENKKAVLEII